MPAPFALGLPFAPLSLAPANLPFPRFAASPVLPVPLWQPCDLPSTAAALYASGIKGEEE
jgi:hypothetical protein